MSEFKGTPGEWEAEHDFSAICVGHQTLARVYFAEGRSDAENIANAKLFAASKDLLEALRPFANYACNEDPNDPCACHNCRARDVIRKATT